MKIFCIGLFKTGTVSLHTALLRLGYSSIHWGGPEAYLSVQRAVDEGVPVLTYLDDVDAYSDIETLSRNFHLADAQYPGSRFIVTVRALDPWLDSVRRHVEKNQQRKARGEYTGEFLDVDLDAWTELWTEHHQRVADHFAERDGDLLVMNITEGDGWDALAPFLRHPIPLEPFPFENRYAPVQPMVRTSAAETG